MKVAPDKLAEFRTDVLLADLTTIHLGGNARHFVDCRSIDEIISAINFFQTIGDPIMVLGGGSNVVFSDHGFDGLVLRVSLKGISFVEDGDCVVVTAQAGEIWDDFVKLSVDKSLAGIECLSGIPGTVGATPIQDVGAYGQEVRETITSVKVLERSSLELIDFNSSDCKFGYRSSRFKREDKDRYIVVEVSFRLKRDGEPSVKYKELKDLLGKTEDGTQSTPERRNAALRRAGTGHDQTTLGAVREAVMTLRKKKSMVIDPYDTNSRSVGSFFVNPVLDDCQYAGFLSKVNDLGMGVPPTFGNGNGRKIPAGWLVEKAGYHKGYRFGRVGISANHALALVNFGGTSADLLGLASEIEAKVLKKFGIKLEREAVIVE